MGNATNVPIDGWVSAPNNRGTGDILWSCGMTVLLCCWVSVYPNVGSPTDKWYHSFLDKLNLFCIALLGPDFLFGIAFGQWSKARASVKVRELPGRRSEIPRLAIPQVLIYSFQFLLIHASMISFFANIRRHKTALNGDMLMHFSSIQGEFT